ncbi:hypothetical protein GC177_01065 [bacterium]|nr:hypothetical protein [bacterium]
MAAAQADAQVSSLSQHENERATAAVKVMEALAAHAFTIPELADVFHYRVETRRDIVLDEKGLVVRDHQGKPVPGVRVFGNPYAGAAQTIGILGMTHGNEPVGLVAVEVLERLQEAGFLNPQARVLFALGNLGAAHEYFRHYDPAIPSAARVQYRGGSASTQLNRLAENVTTALPAEDAPEDFVRAYRLGRVLPLMQKAGLDMHSLSTPSVPYVIAHRAMTESELALLPGMGVNHIAQTQPGLFSAKLLADFVGTDETSVIVVEHGFHETPATFTAAVWSVLTYLRHAGALTKEAERAFDQLRAPLLEQKDIDFYQGVGSTFHPAFSPVGQESVKSALLADDYLLLPGDVRTKPEAHKPLQGLLARLKAMPTQERKRWLEAQQGNPEYGAFFSPIRNFDAFHKGDGFAIGIETGHVLRVEQEGHMILAPGFPLVPKDFPEVISLITEPARRLEFPQREKKEPGEAILNSIPPQQGLRQAG